MTRNKDLFRRIAATLRAQPMHYDQAQWGEDADGYTEHTCGTAHCIAGHAASLEGMLPKEESTAGGRALGLTPRLNWAHVHSPGENRSHRVAPWAQTRLGLTGNEAHILFSGDWIPQGTTEIQVENRRTVALRAATAMERLADGWSIEAVTSLRSWGDTE